MMVMNSRLSPCKPSSPRYQGDLNSSGSGNRLPMIVAPVSSTAETIDQHMYFVDRTDKNKLLVHLLQGDAIREALIFTRTKHGANKVVKVLVTHKLMVDLLPKCLIKVKLLPQCASINLEKVKIVSSYAKKYKKP